MTLFFVFNNPWNLKEPRTDTNSHHMRGTRCPSPNTFNARLIQVTKEHMGKKEKKYNAKQEHGVANLQV
jgi:hypothetical protein